jgi:hypothetical protein
MARRRRRADPAPRVGVARGLDQEGPDRFDIVVRIGRGGQDAVRRRALPQKRAFCAEQFGLTLVLPISRTATAPRMASLRMCGAILGRPAALARAVQGRAAARAGSIAVRCGSAPQRRPIGADRGAGVMRTRVRSPCISRRSWPGPVAALKHGAAPAQRLRRQEGEDGKTKSREAAPMPVANDGRLNPGERRPS